MKIQDIILAVIAITFCAAFLVVVFAVAILGKVVPESLLMWMLSTFAAAIAAVFAWLGGERSGAARAESLALRAAEGNKQ